MMESWCYGSEGKGGVLLSDELDSRTDCVSRSRKVFTGWELKGTGNCQNGLPVGSQGFMEFGFAGNVRKTLSDDPMNGLSSSKIANGRLTASSSTHYPNTFFGEVSIVDSGSRDSSLIDLKLGRLIDSKDVMSGESSKEIRALPSIVSPVPAMKRARSASLNGHTPFCQVHGCNMDLSSSKDYHKRHRVCEIHSKTAKVIVNGIEQRFCQQCSRFHLLAEFDDGKRSCRKRLAGHNERRRKPQIDNHSGRTGKLLPSYHAGGRFMGTSFPARAPILCPDIFPGGVFREVKAENSNWCRQVKVEDAEIYSSTQAVVPTTNNHMFLKNANPSLPGFDATLGSMCYENNCNRYAQDFSSSHSIQWQPIHITTSSGSEEFGVSDLTSTVNSLSGVPHSGCALSLLSSQSQKMHPSGIPMARPLVIQGGLAHYNEEQFPDKLLMAVNSQASTSVASNRFSSSGMSSMEDDHMGAVLVSDASNTIDFEGHADGLFQGCSDFMNVKDPISREHGQTVDWLQLSSQLRGAENQRHQVQVKRENEAFCYLNKS